MKKYLLLILLFQLGCLAAQIAPLSIPTQNHCSFSGTNWEEELYAFDKNAQVQGWIDEILQNGNATQNFEVINASVENVAAVYDLATGKRYLLYSIDFTEKTRKTALWRVYAALAHEIGHHVNNHQLTEERRTFEELEADQFMGYVLCKTKGIASLEESLKIVELLPSSHPSVRDADNRRAAIKNGWLNATKSLIINSAGFDAAKEREEFLKAEFQVLPCCSPLPLPQHFFQNAPVLGKIAEKLKLTLDKQGYYYQSYKSFKGGFALITQMEQFNADYTFRNDDTRWQALPMGGSFKGFMDYFEKLLLPQNRRYRTFVFVVTTQGFSQEERNVQVTKQDAEKWYQSGKSQLPRLIAQEPAAGATVTAIVYEFQIPESNGKPKQTCPTINTKRHLEQSKIWQSF
jgi:hypothetical protein